MSIRSKIQSLISAANTVTGESDITLTDALQTLVDGYGQGGGGLELLVDDVATEDVALINVEIPDDKRTAKAYLVGLKGRTSAGEWIYPHLNMSTPSTAGDAYMAKASTYDLIIVICKAASGVGGYVWASQSIAKPACAYTSSSSLNNILFNLYYADSTFLAGFNVKVWGVPAP